MVDVSWLLVVTLSVLVLDCVCAQVRCGYSSCQLCRAGHMYVMHFVHKLSPILPAFAGGLVRTVWLQCVSNCLSDQEFICLGHGLIHRQHALAM